MKHYESTLTHKLGCSIRPNCSGLNEFNRVSSIRRRQSFIVASIVTCFTVASIVTCLIAAAHVVVVIFLLFHFTMISPDCHQKNKNFLPPKPTHPISGHVIQVYLFSYTCNNLSFSSSPPKINLPAHVKLKKVLMIPFVFSFIGLL